MKSRFTGPLGKFMKRHLKLRRSLGFELRHTEYNLNEFDRYMKIHTPKTHTITRQIVVEYLKTTQHLHSKSRAARVTDLRQFARYMFQFSSDVYIPERALTPKVTTSFKPYIYTESEVQSLISLAHALSRRRSFLVPRTYAAVIGLLWVSGLRIGEVARLNLCDLDLKEGVMSIRETKFFKSRLVPLDPSSAAALSDYVKIRLERWPHLYQPDTPFFVNRDGLRCDTIITSKTIQTLIRKLGLRTAQGRYPRVHDLRHSFATHSLANFYQTGKDPSAMLPVLATFLGHANIANTQTYLHPSVELLEKAGLQFHQHICNQEVNYEKSE